jgi:hypothetical protein
VAINLASHRTWTVDLCFPPRVSVQDWELQLDFECKIRLFFVVTGTIIERSPVRRFVLET